ncbi:IclR family transcriptional regulator [uncultured Microbacterium sp.]|uniref:IclR family transcriptional regulator n=1 Tax=uncultured Microbacterium sp. TaxID=191216 RepID=UPI002620AD1C|nr:IclR family transcriptional regulator [uncultured Microbacterium sp.]
MESVHRALVLLKTIIDHGSLGVTEAAALLDVNASTAQRLLATLVHDGFAVQSPDRRYSAGPALTSPGLSTRIPQLTDRLRPALEALFDRSGETVHLAALHGTRVLHLDGIEARTHTLRFGLRVGVWLPAHATAGGKALLADLTDEEIVQRYADAAGLPHARTDIDMPALLEDLAEVRTTRIASNLAESEPGIAALATSIGEVGGHRIGLSIALPIARYTRDDADRWAQDLREVAEAVRSRQR